MTHLALPSKPLGALVFTCMLAGLRVCNAQEVDGFLEPYLSINVPALEMGAIDTLHAIEGKRVRQGEALAVLDREVHQQLLRIAEQAMHAVGRVESAKAELALNQTRLKKLLSLRAKGYARQEEVERTRADVAVAAADVLTAQEDAAIRRLEYEKARIQLARRTITAPINGVVTEIYKEAGEFVSPNDPYVLQVVQLDNLLANFSVPGPIAARLHTGQRVEVRVGERAQVAAGIIEFVSPIIDAESGTVRIKVRIDNSQERYRSGDRGTLVVPRDALAASTRDRHVHP